MGLPRSEPHMAFDHGMRIRKRSERSTAGDPRGPTGDERSEIELRKNRKYAGSALLRGVCLTRTQLTEADN